MWPGEGGKIKGGPNVILTTRSIVKGSAIDQDRQEGGRGGGISAGPQPSDILEELSFLFCHHLLLHTKNRDTLTRRRPHFQQCRGAGSGGAPRLIISIYSVVTSVNRMMFVRNWAQLGAVFLL